MATIDPSPPSPPSPPPPGDASLAAVFRIDAFRGIWVANVLATIAMGTSRFAFVAGRRPH